MRQFSELKAAAVSTRRNWIMRAGSLMLAFTAFSGPSAAQSRFPSKPLRIVVPFAPGGSNDVVARVFAERLTAVLKQPVYVENKPGAAAVIGAEYVANGPADGYSVLFLGGGSMTPVLIKDLKFDIRKQLRPVIAIARGGMTIMVNSSVAAKTLPEFIEYARRENGKVNYSYTAGSVLLASEMLRTRTGFEATGVPYKGSGDMVNALLSNQIQLALDTPLQYLPLIRDGRLRALAHGGQDRIAALPEVPTLAELGYGDLMLAVSFGAWVPAGTPDDVVQRLNGAFNEVLAQPDVRQRLIDGSMVPTGGPPEIHAKQIASEHEWWANAARKLNYKPE